MGHTPRFFGRPHCNKAYKFRLSASNINEVNSLTAAETIPIHERYWRTPRVVSQRIREPNSIRPDTIDPTIHLEDYDLDERLEQGCGVITRHFCLAIFEEIGRAPDNPHYVYSKAWSWTHNSTVFVRTPLKYMSRQGVVEELQEGAIHSTVEWDDLQISLYGNIDISHLFNNSSAHRVVFTDPFVQIENLLPVREVRVAIHPYDLA
jgi:hypothetical protein